ncbi:hypothetical protein ACIA8K_11105 [Catenuloplanes sp. NPDC051500]|uniref:hypothetical protein n=1 Tax=Catenuloplanes sp. NPDC051500 TaxID=3363959 RepID=UPI0037A8C2FA
MKRLLTPRWIAVHLGTVLLVIAFLALGWWQLSRAEAGGNPSSWGYMLEWPVFAAFVIFLWAREARAVLRRDLPPAAKPAQEPEDPHQLRVRRPVRTAAVQRATGRSAYGPARPPEDQ